ncbi:hypothetical protein [Flavobacterium fluviatile]|uniref:hypothetical protein n=1 Tax=Flavobacterium fluviatile TaxID=1862387 RepID=UPI0013D0ED55|nr:hypothetical protein [Flavobacterium fluviatile]
MSLSKPNGKSIASVAVSAGSFVVGAKLGDGIATVFPDSMASYKGFILAGASILAAACISPKSTMEQAAQSALVGLGAKQLYDEFTGALEGAVPAKPATSTTNKFVNALVSTTRPAGIDPAVVTPGVGAAWLGQPGDLWDRPEEEYHQTSVFTGV